MKATVQVLDVDFQCRSVLVPRHVVDTRARLSLELQERTLEPFGREVVEQIVELDFPVLSRELTYTVQRAWHTFPALRPERVLLVRVSLGQAPSLHHLRYGLTRIVRRLHW